MRELIRSLVPKLCLGTCRREAPLPRGEAELRGHACPSGTWARVVLMAVCLGLLLPRLPLCAEDAAVSKRFSELLAREWEYRLREAPTFASYLGDKRYNDRWPDVSVAATDRRHE